MRSWILIGVLALSLGGFAAMGVLAGPGGSDGDSTEGDSLSPPATVEEPDDDGDALSPPADIDDDEDDADDEGDDVRGVPEDSPACDNHEDTDGDGDGCGDVTNCGGQDLHLPQPAVDNMNGNHCDEEDGAVDDANDDADETEQDATDDADEGEHDANDEGDDGGNDHGENNGGGNSHEDGED